jgi:phage virion morphogenesis protein
MAQITVIDAELQAALSEFIGRTENLKPALDNLGEYLVRKTRTRFDTSTAPDGTKWAPLADKTKKAKQRRATTGKPYRTKADPSAILKDAFTLRDSITYQISSSTLQVGTSIAYGIYHQSEEPRTRLPRRAFLGLDGTDRAEALEIFRDHFSL